MIVLKNATIFRGAGTPPESGATIVVKGDRIESAGAYTGIPDGADIIIDLKGRFVLPGFIDAHVHFGGTEGFDRASVGDRFETYDYLNSRTEALKWGITAVRSAGDFTPGIFEFRDEAAPGHFVSPRIVAAGKMIQARGGHPLDTVFGGNEKIAAGAAVLVDDETDIDEEVRLLADAGADWIKTFISDINKLDYPASVPRIPPEKIKQIVNAAHKYGKPCMVHVDNVTQLREAAQAGADSIEHIVSTGATETEFDDDLIQFLVDKRTFVVPTVFSIFAHENPNGARPLVYEKLIQQVNKLVSAGVNIGVGTDASIPFVPIGVSLHEELAQLVKCGMTPAAAIAAATSGNARLLLCQDELGSISPGFFADLVVVDGDPTSDIGNTKNIRLVILNGRIVVDGIASGL